MNQTRWLTYTKGLLGAFCVFSMVQAQAPKENYQQSQCYEILKDSISENSRFTGLYKSIKNVSYQELEWSRLHMASTSFGIDLNEPLFRVKYATFGEPTAYVHPPQSDLPVSRLTEQWDFEPKKYFIEEEYLTDEAGNLIFQGCLAVHITGEEPIKAEDYWYDSESISVKSQTHLRDGTLAKLLFSSSTSYKYDRSVHAVWDRMFVYVDNQSPYFNRFELVDSVTSNEIGDIKQIFNKKDLPTDSIRPTAVMVTDKAGRIDVMSSKLPEHFSAEKKEGIEKFFPQAKLYEAMEKKFPEVGAKAALWGTYDTDTVEDMYQTLFDDSVDMKDKEELFAFVDTKTYLKKKKENQSDTVTEKMTELFMSNSMNTAIAQKIEDIGVERSTTDEPASSKPQIPFFEEYMVLFILAGVLFLAGIGYFIFRKKQNTDKSQKSKNSKK